jgi:hypothetical protein
MVTPRVRVLVPAFSVAAAFGAASLLLVGGTGHNAAPTRHATTITASACPPAPAACGEQNLDELAIHAAFAAAQQAINHGYFPTPGH